MSTLYTKEYALGTWEVTQQGIESPCKQLHDFNMLYAHPWALNF